MDRIALILILCGCLSHAAPSPSPALVPSVESRDDAKIHLGKLVRFSGRAVNAKLGAAVLKKGVMMVYCLDRSGWKDSLVDKNVIIEGVLEHTDEFNAHNKPGEPMRAGTAGPVWVMRKSTFRPAD
jgi:hypothetical protein